MEFETKNKSPVTVRIDDEDWGRVSQYNWKKYPSCRYVQASINNKTTSISKFIMRAAHGVSVDYINGDRFDNRKANLRICSHAANMKNRRPNKNGQSAYKGVVLLKNGRFRAKIDSDGKRYELGVYPTERDAVVAYNSASKVLHGKFAYMNELPELIIGEKNGPLKNCPFCGGSARQVFPADASVPYVTCVDCYASTIKTSSVDEVTAWNTRPTLNKEE